MFWQATLVQPLLVLLSCSCPILVYVFGRPVKWFPSRNLDMLAPSSISTPDFPFNLFNLSPCSENSFHKRWEHVNLLPSSPFHLLLTSGRTGFSLPPFDSLGLYGRFWIMAANDLPPSGLWPFQTDLLFLPTWVSSQILMLPLKWWRQKARESKHLLRAL